jgi:hypothetical protein
MSGALLAKEFEDTIPEVESTQHVREEIECSSKSPVTPSLFTPGSVYYDTARKEFLVKNGRGVWLHLREGAFKRTLRAWGFAVKAIPGERISPADQRILEIQDTQDVAYAGPLAGCSEGFYDCGSHRLLVTHSPKLIEPLPGGWPTLDRFLGNLFRAPNEVDQRPYVYGWTKIGYESLRAGERRPGQALVLAGPHNCGKSLFQNLLTEIFGGRFAKPYRYMTGQTSFNGDLFGAEHLTIEDEQPSTDLRARRNFGAQIKNFTVNEGQSCHAKYRDAVSLTPFWRVTISLNEEPENLLVLPPLDDSIEDKLIILQVAKHAMPMPTTTLEQRKLFWATLVSELPAFLYFLTLWQVPEELLCPRFGVKHYHHPRLLEAMGALAPERRLMEVIDSEVFGLDDCWQGTAGQLENKLTSKDCQMQHEARRLLIYPAACDTYLSRLAREPHTRVSFRETNRGRIYKIARVGVTE